MATNDTSLRKLPQQERSRTTVSLIVEAALQVLEQSGERGFNTNAIARRAGVSIGSLYQYFPNKQAIVLAISRHDAGREASGRAPRG